MNTSATGRASQIHRAGLVLILVVAALLRTCALDEYPVPVHQDELSNMYDGYSLLTTGADRWGAKYPILVRASGAVDYRSALYAWLSTIPFRIGGFSVTNGRMVSSILGCVVVLLLYLFAGRLAGRTYALAAAGLAALSPWLISFSRVGHEGAILTAFFLPLSLYFWILAAELYGPGDASHALHPRRQRAQRDHRLSLRLLLLGLALGVWTNTYQSARLAAFLLFCMVAVDLLAHSRAALRNIVVVGTGAAVGAAPQLYAMLTQPENFFARAANTVYARAGVMTKLVDVLRGYADNLRPRYLFWPDLSETFLTSARLIPFEVVLFPLGIAALWRFRSASIPRFGKYLYFVAFIAVLPAALADQNPHSLRASLFAAVSPLISAAGFCFLLRIAERLGIPRRISGAAVTALICATFSYVAYSYAKSPHARFERMQNHIFHMAHRLALHAPAADTVIVETAAPRGWVPGDYLYVAAFTPIHPREFQSAVKDVERGAWDVVRGVGKYKFRDSAGVAPALADSRGTNARTLAVTLRRYPGWRPIDSLRAGGFHYFFSVPEARGEAVARQVVARTISDGKTERP